MAGMRANGDAFVPARGLAHPFAQTAYGVFVRPLAAPPVVRERWETPDGDVVEVDVLDMGGAPARGFVVLVHGLEGSSRSPYMRGMLDLAHARGLLGFALNFRHCGDEPNRFARCYHAGHTDDVGFVART